MPVLPILLKLIYHAKRRGIERDKKEGWNKRKNKRRLGRLF